MSANSRLESLGRRVLIVDESHDAAESLAMLITTFWRNCLRRFLPTGLATYSCKQRTAYPVALMPAVSRARYSVAARSDVSISSVVEDDAE